MVLPISRSFRYALPLVLLIGSTSLFAQEEPTNEGCIWCHSKPELIETPLEELRAMVRIVDEKAAVRTPEEIQKLYIPTDTFTTTAHSQVGCLDCHPVSTMPHDNKLPPVDCGACHEKARDLTIRGSHNPALSVDGKERPQCLDCHGPSHHVQWLERKRTYKNATGQVWSCLKCHDQKAPGKLNPGREYLRNIHGQALFKEGLPFSATCTDCHGAHGMLPASDPESPIHPLKVMDTCGACHQGVEDIYLMSVHGKELAKGNPEGATCTTCHRDHGIHSMNGEFVHSVISECSHCHLDLGKTYLASYHGKATTLGHHSVAVCSSCHGHHDILPKSDPGSRITANNLNETCGTCHPDSNENFIKFAVHVDHRDRERFPEVFYTWIAMTTLLLSVLAFFVPHALLWAIREMFARLRNSSNHHHNGANERYIERFRPVHRWTHLLIVVSFMGLVATGFPLKYSYTDWAKQLSSMFGGAEVMGLLHRLFAIMTFAYAGLHLIHLVRFFILERPKHLFRFLFGPDSMIMSMRDVKDFFGMMRWFFFLGPKPKFERWTYLEKFDYFGEMWGVIIIGGSGLILWFPEFFTRWLPGWVLNCVMVVHSIEALLAASVIFLVHFLNTHLRPDKFPVDMVMLTGQMSESEMKEERPAEYERLVAEGKLESRIVPKASQQLRFVGRILGIFAFLCGLALIILALVSEYRHFF